MSKWLFALLTPGFVTFALSQPPAQLSPKDQAQAQQKLDLLKNAQSAGVVLNSTSNVRDSVNIEAVMLPETIVRSVFGKEVSDHYAVIEVNILNRNPDAAFILGSLYIDYSQWGLANGMIGFNPSLSPRDYASAADSRLVSSVEYRVIRGELLDRQPYTWRNVSSRSIKVLGSIGTAFAFPFSRDVIKGINAWNGGVVPGFDELFPDGTQAQMNRISDYGFRNNKVIPQQSADIVIAFFPIQRFLSPTLEKTFKSSPALFFNPLLLALDPKTRPHLERLLENALGDRKTVDVSLQGLLKTLGSTDAEEFQVLGTEIQTMETQLSADRKQLEDESKKLKNLNDSKAFALQSSVVVKATAVMNDDLGRLRTAQAALTAKFKPAGSEGDPIGLYRFLSQISLSNVAVVVAGTMNVDEQTIPASISESCFDKPAPEFWGTKGTKTCTIRGRFLLRGVPKLQGVEGADLGVSDIAVVESQSSSDLLTFTCTLKTAIDPPRFTLIVSKEGKNKTSVDSTPYGVNATVALPTPQIASLKTDGVGAQTSVIVAGQNFFNVSKAHTLSASLHPAKGEDISVESPSADSTTTVTLPAASLQKKAAGCYNVIITVGTSPSNTSKDAIKIEAASAGSKTITKVDACPN